MFSGVHNPIPIEFSFVTLTSELHFARGTQVMANILAFFRKNCLNRSLCFCLTLNQWFQNLGVSCTSFLLLKAIKSHTLAIDLELQAFAFRRSHFMGKKLLLRSYTYKTRTWIKRDITEICAKRRNNFHLIFIFNAVSKRFYQNNNTVSFSILKFFVCVIFYVKQFLSNWLISEKYSYLLGTNSLVLKLCGY